MNNKLIDNIVKIIPIIISIIALVVSVYLPYKTADLNTKKNAAILYSDLKFSLEGIDVSKNDFNNQVISTSYSDLVNNYQEYITNVYEELGKDNYKNITVLYHNLKLLENARLNYLNNKDASMKQKLNAKFIDALNANYYIFTKKEMLESIQKLNQISGMSDNYIVNFEKEKGH